MKTRKFIRDRFRAMFANEKPTPRVEAMAEVQDVDLKAKLKVESVYQLGKLIHLATIDGEPCLIRGRWDSPSCYVRNLKDLEGMLYAVLLEKDPEGIVDLPVKAKKLSKK